MPVLYAETRESGSDEVAGLQRKKQASIPIYRKFSRVKSYADALYSLAKEAGACEEVLDDTQKLRASFREEPGFLRVLSSSEINRAEKWELLDACLKGRAHDYVLSCLKLMCDKGHIKAFPAVCENIKQLYNEDKGILSVTVTSARPLSDDQAQRLKSRLEEISGKKAELTMNCDSACIGGLRIEYSGISVEDTVRRRLDELKKLMQTTSV